MGGDGYFANYFYIGLPCTVIAFFAILDRVIAKKTKALKFELEQNTKDEDEPLSNKEKVLLKSVVLWSRIRLGVGIIMFIGLLIITLFK